MKPKHHPVWQILLPEHATVVLEIAGVYLKTQRLLNDELKLIAYLIETAGIKKHHALAAKVLT